MTDVDIRPVEVSFKHDPPADLTSYHQAFACPVLFQQSQCYISFRTADLEIRTAKADESINKFLVERVEEETKGIDVNPSKIVSDVEKIIKNALPSGIPSMEKVSGHVGMSNRTLTRRLAESGTTFRTLIKKIQAEISKDLLLNSSSNVGEIAFQLGFSEQSAFNRAFKRWTGLSPVEFRKIK
jgi:AraC-like DNA-binding protein